MRIYLFLKVVTFLLLFLIILNCSKTETPFQNKAENKILLESNSELVMKSKVQNKLMTSFRYVEDEKGQRYLEVLEGNTLMLRIKKGESIFDNIKEHQNRLKPPKSKINGGSFSDWHPNAPSLNVEVDPEYEKSISNKSNSVNYDDIFRLLDSAADRGEDLNIIDVIRKNKKQ